jgi:cytochrome c oxidase assembly factor CtaG
MAVILAAVCFGYFFLNRFSISGRSIYFLAGFLLLVLSVASPLRFLGDHYLMSAHMITHVGLLLVAAPLMVLGISENNHHSILDRLSVKIGAAPWLAWLAGVLVMWFWHIPVIFNSLFENPDNINFNSGDHFRWILQDLQDLNLVLAGILFCWPVIGPVKYLRIAPLKAVLYLSTACVSCSILGLMITFAPLTVYNGYAHATDHFGYLNLIRNEKGITQLVDQQFAGLIMWVPGCLIYLSASMILLLNWFHGNKDHAAFTETIKTQ